MLVDAYLDETKHTLPVAIDAYTDSGIVYLNQGDRGDRSCVTLYADQIPALEAFCRRFREQNPEGLSAHLEIGQAA